MEEFIVKYWLEFLFGLIIGIIGYFVKKIKKKQEEQIKKQKEQEERYKAMERGVQALLRNGIIKNYREAKIEGEIQMLDKENMEHMFEEYFNLGGNGLVVEVHEEFLKIPIKIVK
jgi:chemotaxis receptor (MCP) glutamine deamidase CheD